MSFSCTTTVVMGYGLCCKNYHGNPKWQRKAKGPLWQVGMCVCIIYWTYIQGIIPVLCTVIYKIPPLHIFNVIGVNSLISKVEHAFKNSQCKHNIRKREWVHKPTARLICLPEKALAMTKHPLSRFL